jgi:hypothetical protein
MVVLVAGFLWLLVLASASVAALVGLLLTLQLRHGADRAAMLPAADAMAPRVGAWVCQACRLADPSGSS